MRYLEQFVIPDQVVGGRCCCYLGRGCLLWISLCVFAARSTGLSSGFLLVVLVVIASVGGGCETVSAGTAVGSLCLLVGAAPLFVVVVALLPGPVDCRAPLIMGEVAEEE